MSQTSASLPEYQTPFTPSDEQKERAEALKRFNRLYVLTPIIAVSVVTVLIIATMIILAIAPNYSENTVFISALADMSIIMFTIPMIILMLSGPLLLIGLINLSRKRRKLGKPAFDQGGGLQVLLWKLDLLVQKSQSKTNEVAPQLADQVIRFNEAIAYVGAFFNQIINAFKRS